MPESCLDPVMGYTPAYPSRASVPGGNASLPGYSTCTIGDAGRVESDIYAIVNSRLIMPARRVLPDGASRTALSSEHGDSGHSDRHGVSGCIIVLGGTGCPDVFGNPSYPEVLDVSSCPSSSTPAIPNGVLITPDGASLTT